MNKTSHDHLANPVVHFFVSW